MNVMRVRLNRFWLGLAAVCLMLPALSAISAGKGPGIDSNEALKMLKDGNERFVSGEREYPHLDKDRIDETSTGQAPFVTIVSCSDSRVPPEHVFDSGIGDLFVIRLAGNVCDVDSIGTIEYGVVHLQTPLLVILGHTSCGAVTAVVQEADVHGSIPKLVDNIVPAVEKVKHDHSDLEGDDLISASIKQNVWQSIEDTLLHSPETAELVKEGKLKVVGAIYALDSGEVEWLGEHPEQEKLLKD